MSCVEPPQPCCTELYVEDTGTGRRYKYTNDLENINGHLAYKLPATESMHSHDHALYYAAPGKHWHIATKQHALTAANSRSTKHNAEAADVKSSSMFGAHTQCPEQADWSRAGISVTCTQPLRRDLLYPPYQQRQWRPTPSVVLCYYTVILASLLTRAYFSAWCGCALGRRILLWGAKRE